MALPLLLSTLPAQPIRFLDELIDVFATKSMLRDTAEKNTQLGVSFQVPLGLFTDTTTPRHQFVEFKRELNGDPSKHVLGWHRRSYSMSLKYDGVISTTLARFSKTGLPFDSPVTDELPEGLLRHWLASSGLVCWLCSPF